MKGPFPGMDPWLEKHWGDIHSTLITYIRDELQTQLPGNLVAQAEESVTADQPIVIQFPEETTRWVEIRDLDSGNEVVTVIEVLSPRNKVSQAGRAEYKKKQREYFEAAINIVEIDLLRSGERIFLACPPNGIPSKNVAPYYVSVTRGVAPGARELYPLPLSKPLSNIAIPLREADEDVVLPLQTLLDRCYQMGRYNIKINYSEQPTPNLEETDFEWAEHLVREWKA